MPAPDPVDEAAPDPGALVGGSAESEAAEPDDDQADDDPGADLDVTEPAPGPVAYDDHAQDTGRAATP